VTTEKKNRDSTLKEQANRNPAQEKKSQLTP